MALPPESPAPDVSVIIAAYMCAATLDRAIDSALAQGGVTVEVVVADDASTDATAARAGARAAADARVICLAATQNGGPSAARNRAIAAASGRWIAVLDADDAFAPGRLERLVAFGEARGADVVLDNLTEVDGAGGALPGGPFLALTEPEEWDLSRWAMDNRVLTTPCTGFLKPLIRRAALTRADLRYREELRNSEDYALIADLLASGARLWAHPAPGYLYTREAGSTSHRYRSGELDRLIGFAHDFRAKQEPTIDTRTRAALAAHLTALQNASALTRGIAALQEGRPLGFAGQLARRPRALPLFARWCGEVIGKRLAGRR